MSVERIETRISPDILDTIGRSFKFNHGKGVAEWLKNSLDHYLRLHHLGEETLGGNWPVLLNLINMRRAANGPNLILLDFGGTTFDHIQEFFLNWGDTKAATHGGSAAAARLTGGHGNGGKFYMREMWRSGARMLTWRSGKVTSLVVEKAKDGTTGFWERKNTANDWRSALAYAMDASDGLGGVDWLFDHLEENEPQLIVDLENGRRGFTVIVGRRGKQLRSSNDVVRGGRWDEQRLVDDIRSAPQARRPIRELSIAVFVDGVLRIEELHPESIENDPDWNVETVSLPMELLQDDELAADASDVGALTLQKAASPLRGRSRYLNAIFVIDGEENPIASYPLGEIPLPGHSPLIEFLHGELRLTFPQVHNLVENDRERLVRRATTLNILDWVGENIWQRVKQVEKEQRAAKRRGELDVASELNNLLNKHARRFLNRLETEIMVDFIDEPSGGGDGRGELSGGPFGEETGPVDYTTNGGSGGGSGGAQPGHGGHPEKPRRAETPGKKKKRRRPKFPRVLLSGHDPDPSDLEGATKHLTERHPPLYQGDEDRLHNVWWLNTIHPFASQALRRGGARGPWFKSYHLFMFSQMVQHESLRLLQRREAELAIDVVEGELMKYVDEFLATLPVDLVDSLLDIDD